MYRLFSLQAERLMRQRGKGESNLWMKEEELRLRRSLRPCGDRHHANRGNGGNNQLFMRTSRTRSFSTDAKGTHAATCGWPFGRGFRVLCPRSHGAFMDLTGSRREITVSFDCVIKTEAGWRHARYLWNG
jgi:hypothetical protein